MLTLTKIFVELYANYSKIDNLFLLNWSTLMQESIPNNIKMFTEFFLALLYTFGF